MIEASIVTYRVKVRCLQALCKGKQGCFRQIGNGNQRDPCSLEENVVEFKRLWFTVRERFHRDDAE